jgi:uncharacterized protein (TIGR02246 family)
VASEKPKTPKDQPLEDKEELTPNPTVDDFFSRMNYDMRRPKPGQEAVSAALHAIQRLGVQSDSEESLAAETSLELPEGMCNACGNQNPAGNKFCASCGVPLMNAATPERNLSPILSSPRQVESIPGPHHYHHHYHHHYFSSEGSAQVGPPQSHVRETSSPPRELGRPRTPLTGATLSRAEAAVRKVTQDWALACNTTHLDDVVELYTPDAIVMRPNVPLIKGTASIREFLFSVLDAGLGEVELDPLRTEIFGEVAFEAGRCKMLVPTTTGKRREERGKYMVILTRQAGEWKIIADSWSSDLSMGGGESVPAKMENQNPIARPVRK